MRTFLNQESIIRLPDVLEIVGFSRASLYNQINQGLFPSQINLGARSVGWVYGEVMAVVKARIAGFTDEEIQDLVAELINARHSNVDKGFKCSSHKAHGELNG